MADELVRKMRHLVAMHGPQHGGPYMGYAAESFVQTMTEAADEIEKLERWKEEALVVLTGWEAVWHELGMPGPIGTSKSTACIREIRELKMDITR